MGPLESSMLFVAMRVRIKLNGHKTYELRGATEQGEPEQSQQPASAVMPSASSSAAPRSRARRC